MHLRLDQFDGPLDLLLYLIKVQEMDIFQIPIHRICAQYLSLIRQVRDLDYVAAGEYLAMAAQLIEIKARLLLPTLQGKHPGEPGTPMDADDPRGPLVEALLAYETIRAASTFLSSRTVLGRDQFPSGESQRRGAEFAAITAPLSGDPLSLVIALERVLLSYARRQDAPRVRVHAQRITIQDKIAVILARLEELPSVTLGDLFAGCTTRYELIVTLMATLELAKTSHLALFQEEPFGPIVLSRGEGFFQQLPAQAGEQEEGEL